MHQEHLYQPVHQPKAQGEEHWEPFPRDLGPPSQPSLLSSSRSAWNHIALVASVLIGVFLVGAITGSVIVAVSKSTTPSAEAIFRPGCGDSSTQAREQGCVFDIMTFCWVRPECNDAELTEEFLHLKEWEWFADMNGTTQVPIEEATRGDSSLFVTWDYHTTHCIFMYKKMHRALLRGSPIDSHLASYEHTEHCSEMALVRGYLDGDLINTGAPLRFTKCVDTWARKR